MAVLEIRFRFPLRESGPKIGPATGASPIDTEPSKYPCILPSQLQITYSPCCLAERLYANKTSKDENLETMYRVNLKSAK